MSPTNATVGAPVTRAWPTAVAIKPSIPLAPRLTAMVGEDLTPAACMSASRIGMLFPTKRVVPEGQPAEMMRAVEGSSNTSSWSSRRASRTRATVASADFQAST